MTWLQGRGKPWTFDVSFRSNVAANIDGVVKRAETMACKLERDKVCKTVELKGGLFCVFLRAQNPNNGSVPVEQTITNLISMATNPIHLMKMSDVYLPWF